MRAALQTQMKALTSLSFTPVSTSLLLRKCAYGRSPGIAGKCEEFGNQRLSLQRATQNPELETRNSIGVPPIVHEVLRSPGQPLDPQTRAFMEPRFGHSFSQVRIHTDSKAAESAQAVNASAYTVGSHIAFASKQYAPGTATGNHLIAHELAHSIQQASSTPQNSTLEIGHPTDTHENEADLAADQVLSQRSPVRVSGTTAEQIIQRQGLGEGPGEDTPSTTEVPASPGEGATPLAAPSLPRPFRFTVSTGPGWFPDVFRTPSNGNFSITAQAVMSATPSSRASYWIQPITRGFHLNGEEKEFTTGIGNVTQTWSDIAGDVDCSLRISTANTNPNNALRGSGTIDP